MDQFGVFTADYQISFAQVNSQKILFRRISKKCFEGFLRNVWGNWLIFKQLSVPSNISHNFFKKYIEFTSAKFLLAISQLRTAKHLWIVWRDNAKWQKTLKVKIGARNYKRCLIISIRKSLKSCLLYRFCVLCPFALSSPCMLCGLK